MRGRRGGGTFWLAATLLAGTLLLAGCATGSSQGACAAPAPTLEVRPARAAPSETFRLHGAEFAGRYYCDDTGTGDGEAGGNSAATPARDVRVELRQGARTWKLATVDAGRKLGFDVRIEVPVDVRPGRATVRAVGGGVPAETPLRVLGKGPDEASSGLKSSRITLSAGERSEAGMPGVRVPPAEDALEVPVGSEMVLGFGGEGPPAVRATVEPLDGESAPYPQRARELPVRRVGGSTLVRPTLPPGDYALEVSARPSRGRASYGFRVRVGPTREQLLREERPSRRGVGGVCGFEGAEL